MIHEYGQVSRPFFREEAGRQNWLIFFISEFLYIKCRRENAKEGKY
jgi:hypothetical protein